MNSLLATYPENGRELYNTLDYWRCKELLEIANSGRINPEDRIQAFENETFNLYLDKYANKKTKWMHINDSLNLWTIKAKSPTFLETSYNNTNG